MLSTQVAELEAKYSTLESKLFNTESSLRSYKEMLVERDRTIAALKDKLGGGLDHKSIVLEMWRAKVELAQTMIELYDVQAEALMRRAIQQPVYEDQLALLAEANAVRAKGTPYRGMLNSAKEALDGMCRPV